MNETLYRGKRKRSMGGDDWIYGSYAKRKNILTGEFIHEIGFQLEGQEHLMWIEIIPETLELRVEIDGFNIFTGDYDNKYGVVVFDKHYLGFFCRPEYPYRDCEKPLYECTNFKVSGNIHDNPELLE